MIYLMLFYHLYILYFIVYTVFYTVNRSGIDLNKDDIYTKPLPEPMLTDHQ